MSIEDSSNLKPEEKLENYLTYGILSEVIWAEEARALALVIGNHASKINHSEFRFLFGRLQDIFSERETLGVAKIFDKPDRNYPVRSVSSILNLIEDYSDLWTLSGKNNIETFLLAEGIDTKDRNEQRTYFECCFFLPPEHAECKEKRFRRVIFCFIFRNAT